MRRLALPALLLPLSACGGGAEMSGTALGIPFGDTRYVFFGGPFIAISNIEMDCEQLSFVRSNYEVGQAPTDDDTQLLQFGFTQTAEVSEGQKAIAVTASVSAAVVKVVDGAFDFAYADGGVLDVESVSEDEVEGNFEGVAFDDGSLNGTFKASWCRNLKDR